MIIHLHKIPTTGAKKPNAILEIMIAKIRAWNRSKPKPIRYTQGPAIKNQMMMI